MKYVSIDIETTGLNPETCQIIEFGAVAESPQHRGIFHRLIRHSIYQGEPYAFSMHPKIFKELADGKGITPEELAPTFHRFLRGCGFSGKINVAGKNFASFDAHFLSKLPYWNELIKIRHCILDPTMLYMYPEDETLPDMQTCLDRAGIKKRVTHDAIDDALDVVALIDWATNAN